VARKLAAALGLFELDPSVWLLARRDRQVIAKGLDAKKIEALLAARQAARAAKDFAESDRLRAELKAMGVEVLDSPSGTTWKVA
ncbi:MAG TPA: cysteine--tRNA ligase, partial [Archangium sp.]